MSLFGKSEGPHAGKDAGGAFLDPPALLEHLRKHTAAYNADVDAGRLFSPACTRGPSDTARDARAIWQHTRLEAIRYVMMVPGLTFEPLTAPGRQQEMIDVFLRERPHEETVIDFSDNTLHNFAVAIIAGFNWLNNCARLAHAPPEDFARTLRHVRRIVEVAQRWWALDGAEPRCQEMLARHQPPPLMIYLIWAEYTRLSRIIASAAIFGASNDNAGEVKRKLAEGPLGIAVVAEAKARLERALDPDDPILQEIPNMLESRG